MSSGWENLRRQSGVGEELAKTIDQLFTTASKLERLTSVACKEADSIVTEVKELKTLLDSKSLDQVKLSDLPNVPEGSTFQAEFYSIMDKLYADMDKTLDNSDAIDPVLVDVKKGLFDTDGRRRSVFAESTRHR